MLKATPRKKLSAAQAPLVAALVEDDRLLREEIGEHLAAYDFVVHSDNTLESGALCDLYSSDESDELMSKRMLEELVHRLRKKFKAVQEADAEPAVKSVWGVGYQLCLRMSLV